MARKKTTKLKNLKPRRVKGNTKEAGSVRGGATSTVDEGRATFSPFVISKSLDKSSP